MSAATVGRGCDCCRDSITETVAANSNAMRLEVLHHASSSDFRKVCGDNVRLGLLLAARKVPTAEAFHAFAQEVSGWPVESSLDGGVWK